MKPRGANAPPVEVQDLTRRGRERDLDLMFEPIDALPFVARDRHGVSWWAFTPPDDGQVAHALGEGFARAAMRWCDRGQEYDHGGPDFLELVLGDMLKQGKYCNVERAFLRVISQHAFASIGVVPQMIR